MNITLQYFDGCPNWTDTDLMLKELIGELGVAAEVEYQLIDTREDAIRFGFRGSPTVLIEGLDPFADPQAPMGLSCRVYRTATGPAGTPPRCQLQAALFSQQQEGQS